MAATTGRRQRATTYSRPLLGFRRQPGRLALAIFRMPLPLYRAGLGWLLGHVFLLVTHAGRKTGRPYATAAMVLSYDKGSGEVVVCSVWGPQTDWIRNLRARPALEVRISRDSYIPQQRFLTADESFAVAKDFRRRHPWRLRLISRVLGLADLGSDAAVREFVSTRPVVAFRPAPEPKGRSATTAGTKSSKRFPWTRED
jgi:deazaflavin-dependent oxidoreductase (nitroreductase family)